MKIGVANKRDALQENGLADSLSDDGARQRTPKEASPVSSRRGCRAWQNPRVHATTRAAPFPTELTVTFPPGTISVYSVREDRRSMNSPTLNLSVGNTIVVEAIE
jgi:hypothetical protein